MNSRSDSSTVFEFERDFEQSLRCVPMSVRMKLDLSGVKISLKQWNRLSAQDRQQLLQSACASPDERARFARQVQQMVEARTAQSAGALPVDPSPPWEIEGEVPTQIIDRQRSLGLAPLSLAQWQGLSAVRRFALLKLSRPGHDNENFVPALREFGLL